MFKSKVKSIREKNHKNTFLIKKNHQESEKTEFLKRKRKTEKMVL